MCRHRLHSNNWLLDGIWNSQTKLLYSFCDVRINVCVSVTFVYILSWIRRLPQAAIRALVSTVLVFCRHVFATCKTNTPRAIGLRDSHWGKAAKLDRFQDVFAGLPDWEFDALTTRPRCLHATFVRLRVPFTRNHLNRAKIRMPCLSMFRVNRVNCYIPRLSLN